ncbi:MAG: V-type ATP synthase subunit D [Candidatus Marsarchaeota archaeon]|nr:V-type ATP synthase subunit D [Candidatus Marsarchaeota archaeon]MCL5106128.1 V-type ATP synthase subunit D [Candidatus Marsarchaeota archaeon]
MALNPTRMNLINLKKNAALAKKGHEILKKKQEVLVMEFLRLVKESKNNRQYLSQVLQDAYKTGIISSAYIGNFEIDEASFYAKERAPIKIRIKNIMGVRIPEINKEEKAALEYNMLSTSSAIDDIENKFSKLEDTVIDIAKREQNLKKLALEIDKTKRRVNTLEQVLIPRIKSQAKYISFKLDEIERSSFISLKFFKEKVKKE